MYNKIKIFVFIAIASFALMIALSVTGEMIPFRYATAVIVTIFSLFFIFGLSMVPIMIKAVLRGNISLWNRYPVSGRGFSERMRQRIIENEKGIFYALLISFWAVYILGLAIALPFMIKDKFFEPEMPQPGASIYSKPLKKSSLGVIASPSTTLRINSAKQSREIAAAPLGPRNDFFRGLKIRMES